jgi:hypothetical protein
MITADDLTYGLVKLKAKQPACALYDRYYRGNQRLAFASDAFITAFGGLFKEFAYNRCAAVIDAVADRLEVTGWESDANEGTELPIETRANELWRLNRMQRRQGELYAEVLRSGDGYLVVWPDPETGEARFMPNAGHLMTVVYDNEYGESIAYAVKTWQEVRGENVGKWRVTVYEPDIVRRYITAAKRDEYPDKASLLIPFAADDQPEADNPYGRVPVFHFANNASTGKDGTSDLADVIPLQDALNKSVMDGLVAAEFLGFPQRVVTGIDPVTDLFSGEEKAPFNVAMDRLIVLSDAAAKFGQFDAADMGQFTNLQNEFDIKIARVSRVPVHWLNQMGNNFSSGEALKTAEAPLASKVIDRQAAFGDTWSDAMQFALTIDGKANDAMGIQPIWASAQTRSELDTLNAAAIKASLGVPQEQIWAELDYTPDEIVEFTAAAEKKRKEQMDQFATAFDRGTVPIGG